MAADTVQPLPDYLRQDAGDDKPGVVRAELILETHHVTGIIEQPGGPQRLVDVLNRTEASTVVVREAIVESPAGLGEATQHFELLHVRRETILLAVPLSIDAPAPGHLETVEKRPAAATLVLPGVAVTGHIHLPPEADPGAVRLLGRHDFFPVTEAEVTQAAFDFHLQRQPLVVVSLERALFYAPATR